MTADCLQRCRGFRVLGKERAYGCGIDFPGLRIGRSYQLKIVEILRSIDGKNRDVDHAGAPLFAVRLLEENCQAANGFWRVVHKGLSAGEGKASHDGHAAGAEDLSLGDGLPLSIALEIAGDTDAFGVIPAESRMLSVQALKRVDQSR